MNILDVLESWSMHSGPLYRRLATAIQSAIASGEIPPGTALPAERHLAKSLALSRSTVVGAYDLLRAEGLVESRQGSGTWVAGAARTVAAGNTQQESLRGAALSGTDSLVDLATASLPADTSVLEAFDAIRGDLLIRLLSSAGYSALGLPELRRAVADTFTQDGIPTTADQVLITTGDQQALSLICGHVLELGDTAVVEDPTSPGILDLLREAPVAVRSCRSLSTAGAAPLVDTIAKANPGLVYVLSSLGPEGRVADDRELRTLAAALRDYAGVIVEDASSRYLVAGERPPLLAQLAPHASVLTVGSMSKVFWGGLRVGWIRGDENSILRLSRGKARADLGTPLISQLLAAWLLRRLDEVSANRISELSHRQQRAAQVVSGLLPEFRFEPPAGGATIWLRMPRGASRPFSELARRHGIAVVPGSALSAGGASDGYLRLALGSDDSAFRDGVQRLARAWTQYDNTAATRELTQAEPLV
ncbi:MAG: PLP-dependent aminotransferase family protein [Microbacterium sp.]|uniref:aminotransferase-like domain-containing protein n=1 Tax=Microbacterium sp. TaxID=51671 RepID=UPI0039E61FA1